MGKFKPARGKGKKPSGLRGAVPCLILLLSGMTLLFVLFWAFLQRGT